MGSLASPTLSDREAVASVAVIVERRAIESQWQSHVWRVEAVEFDRIGGAAWRTLRETPSSTLVRIGNVPMTLHRKEMMGYKVNFANGEPRIYAAIQVKDFDSNEPVSVDLVTASALEVQAYGHTQESVTDSVPMPDDVLEWVCSFMAMQAPEDEAFVKRQRDRGPRAEDYKFGKMPIEDVRRESARREAGAPQHPLLDDSAGRRRRG
jgi:hypothetical protein